MDGTRKCGVDSCLDPVATRFARRDLCVQHFLSHCYEDLERFDSRTPGSLDHSESTRLSAFVDECSRCALEVSLKSGELDNLQRARLLDILLWASGLWPKTSAQCTPGPK